jgi:hypothetical protein
MKEKKELNRAIHGEGKKVSPNMHRVTVYLYNPPRKGAAKGSKTFKTTHTFNNVDTPEKAMDIIGQFTESRIGYVSYSLIKKAEYNGKCIVMDGELRTGQL